MKYVNAQQPSMFYGATPITFERAKKLRKNLTNEERLVWEFLKSRPQSFKFRKQHPIGFYIADFYCHALKLVIEIDGEYHLNPDQKNDDILREKQMSEWNITTLRFTNDRVSSQFDIVKAEILKFIRGRSRGRDSL